ncbi:MAG: HAMP domain-containing histidine kinase [Rhizobiaceae bacterium]|nr:HAMP domain-containing histidine kinase [Rhizobiaceae bacterium]
MIREVGQGFVALSKAAEKIRTMRASVEEGCRRLVDTAGLSADAARVRLRLTGTLIAAPLIAVSATSVVMAQAFGPGVLAVAGFAVFGLCWLGGLFVAAYGHEKAISACALAFGALLVAGLIALGGGVASPLVLLGSALIFEPWWVWRSRKALMNGTIAAFASVALSYVLPFESGVGASVAFWLPVLLYGGLVAARIEGRASTDQAPSALDEIASHLDAVVLRLNSNGEVADATGRTSDLMRLPPEILLQQGLFDRVHVADRVAYMCALSDLRNGARNRRLNLRLRLPDDSAPAGTYEWFSVEIMDVQSDAKGLFAILRPSHELEALHARLAESEQRAEQAELSKSSFLASVSHELRTPLNAIIGFSDMLTHELYGRFADPRQKEHVGLINEAGHHLLSVVNAILDVSKIELGAYALNREEFPLEGAIKTSLAMVAVEAARKNISIDSRLEEQVAIQADRRAVCQMLINLLSNAVKFTPEGGSVTIGAEREASHIRLWVRDTGIGIAAEDVSRLGQPFVQVGGDYSRKAEGTGLGLALVKGLAQLHGGSIEINSRVGDGTTVTVLLPNDVLESATPTPSAEVQVLKSRLDHGAFRKTA